MALSFYLHFAIFAFVIFFCDATITHIRVQPDFGCASKLKDGLFRHRDVSACQGAWQGHVKDAKLCSKGWHVCSVNDTELLSAITWYEASHLHGCYAMNAAQNSGICQQCTAENDDMAGIGADCPHVNEASQSCFGKGKIDASCCSATYNLEACAHTPWISGVVCCRDRRVGAAPTVTVSPVSSLLVPKGEEILLKCKASGDPDPTITWYKNSVPIVAEGVIDEVTKQGDLVFSRLTIPQARLDSGGLYLCRAENRHGMAISYSSDVTVYEHKPEAIACKNKAKQQLLHRGNIAACGGAWKGTVKRATRQLCAKGWHVCGLKDLITINKLSWTETTSLTGCYAYNVATSRNFACTKCSRRQKGNKMSGIGSGCGTQDRGLVSCLNKGRIDVWGEKNQTSLFDVGSQKNRRSCKYKEGLTTGVMCCQNKRRTRTNSRKGNKKRCATPCGSNSHCSRRGYCKCDKGYKDIGGACVSKSKRERRCFKVLCQNGGKCRRGTCICSPPYTGLHCERVSSWLEDSIH